MGFSLTGSNLVQNKMFCPKIIHFPPFLADSEPQQWSETLKKSELCGLYGQKEADTNLFLIDEQSSLIQNKMDWQKNVNFEWL